MTFNDIIFRNIIRDKWSYISYFLSSVILILIFFFFLTVAFHPSLSNVHVSNVFEVAMTLSGVVVYIFSFFLIGYGMLICFKNKIKSLGIFMITGASAKQIRKIIFRENMIIGLTAILFSLCVGLIFCPLFFMILKKMFHINDFGMYLPLRAILITTLAFTILFLIISMLIARFIKKEEVSRFLNLEKIAEKNIKSVAIRLVSSILITFIMILGVKYNQLIPGVRNIIETMGSDIYFIIFPLLLLSFYFLISQSILFYILVKSKRQSYFKKINMLFIADMKAKSFSFIHSIYLLSILLFAIFLGTSVLYSSYKGVKSWVESVYPFSFQHVALEKTLNHRQKMILVIR